MAHGVRVAVWKDIVVVSDDGRGSADDYRELIAIGEEMLTEHPAGFGLLTVVVENAVPPPEHVRAAMNAALKEVEGSLRAACWYVEGSGFQAAMARAVLTGIRFLSGATYERHVSGSLHASLSWLLPRLEGGDDRLREVAQAVSYIKKHRDSLRALSQPARD